VLIKQKYKELYTTLKNGYFNIYVYIKRYTLIALINLGALTNFIFIKTVSCLKLKIELK
jgi:hypothetical protein